MPARPQQTLALDTGVEQVRFAHGKRLEGLAELGITTIRDLLEHYPFRYDDFSQITKIIDLQIGEKCAVMGTIFEAKGRKTAKGGYLYELTLTDDSGALKAVWFNQRWLADTLTAGKQVLLLGKPEHYGGFLTMSSPLYTVLADKKSDGQPTSLDDSIESIDEGVSPAGIVPVYRANNKVSSNWIKRIVLESRKLVAEPLDPLPARLRMKRRLVSRQIAWHDIHTPAVNEDLVLAHNRLAYEQVFWQQLRFAYGETQQLKGYNAFAHKSAGSLTDQLESIVPFELTTSQLKAIKDISEDMQREKRMNRLLLGDVGSGKTIVALYALVKAAEQGWQSAMMAPTEVLAQQYARAVGDYLDTLGITWTLLSSSMGAAERREALVGLAEGTISVAFGTHALIEPDVIFKTLSLIVIDEQHRFGVDHRKALKAKSPAADFLSMTATPIPRTLALVLYGNVQVSYLENRPQRATITTTSIDSSVSYKAYEAVREALSRGEQAYIVCPLISAPAQPDDEDPAYLDDLHEFFDEPYIAAAEAELEHLRTQVFPEHRIELLTSRIKADDKQRIMSAYTQGEVDILVSTTVIEVGIDVPNATVMIILNADRFGLAQLHQLRGRVGRGTKDSQVFLVAHKPGDSAERRLRLLETHTDGLKLAEADLHERREGDLAGTRQHGTGSLSLINVMRDKNLIEAAHADVVHILDKDADLSLPEHQLLRYELEHSPEVVSD